MPEKIEELVRAAIAAAQEAGDLPEFEVGDLGEDKFDSGAAGDHVAVGEEIGGGPGSDGAESDNSDSDFFHDCGFPMRILKIVKLLSNEYYSTGLPICKFGRGREGVFLQDFSSRPGFRAVQSEAVSPFAAGHSQRKASVVTVLESFPS